MAISGGSSRSSSSSSSHGTTKDSYTNAKLSKKHKGQFFPLNGSLWEAFYNGPECRGWWVKRKNLACCGAHPHGTHMRRRVCLVTCKCNTHEKKSSSCHMLIQYLRGGDFQA